MRPFPPLADLQVFVDDTLRQVRLDPNSLQFVFESGRCLVSESSIEHVEPSGKVWGYGNKAFRDPAILLHRLISKVVTIVDREDLLMSLTFSDGAVLRIFSEIGPYESGHIEGPTGVVTVF